MKPQSQVNQGYLLRSQQGEGGGGGRESYSPIKVSGCTSENFGNTPKRYQNLVLWARPKFISTPKRYQFNNNKFICITNTCFRSITLGDNLTAGPQSVPRQL